MLGFGAFLLCSGLCLQQMIPAQPGLLPKPSLQALPGSLVPLKTQVTIRCQGPPGADLYRLEKLRSGIYQDQPVLFIPAMEERFAGCYRCSYQNGSRWSPPSDRLELVATGVYANKPSLSAQPSPAVSPGTEVTLQCRSQYSFDQFALYKEGAAAPQKGSEKQYWADFPITAVTVAHSGTYRCYSFSSKLPYLWSAPSDPLELVVTGERAADQARPFLPTRIPRLLPPRTGRRDLEKGTELKFEKQGGNWQHYTKGNLVRICIGVVILILLVGLLAEDWHSRKKPLPHRVRPIRRPLPPLPQTQKPHSQQDGGRPDGPNQGRHQ
uniref:Glycoprotein VI platelet n=1 Tax=Ursus americanus TaxID=9643 RepID=A0A452RT11_URSAM